MGHLSTLVFRANLLIGLSRKIGREWGGREVGGEGGGRKKMKLKDGAERQRKLLIND